MLKIIKFSFAYCLLVTLTTSACGIFGINNLKISNIKNLEQRINKNIGYSKLGTNLSPKTPLQSERLLYENPNTNIRQKLTNSKYADGFITILKYKSIIEQLNQYFPSTFIQQYKLILTYIQEFVEKATQKKQLLEYALFFASKRNEHNALKFILQQENLNHNLNISDLRDFWGQSLLHVAACNGNIEVAEILISHGMDINILNNAGQTPFYKATQHKKTQFLIYFN
ncbi:ankyrin repeat domain-containing protein [Candidatus Dependentiae bacterium]